MRVLIFTLLLTHISIVPFAQKNKVDKTGFCGKIIADKNKSISQLQEQFNFLQVQENDTIVDIGASSGWYEGAFCAASELNKVTFILVDVDSNCLNQQKVNNMIDYYSHLKGSQITNQFHLVNNTYDSLFLPMAAYKKVWLLNVLHEVSDQAKMIRNIYNILQPNGEIILMEIIPKKPGELHTGCHKPLFTLQEWQVLFEKGGFKHKDDVQLNKHKNRMTINMIRFVKKAN